MHEDLSGYHQLFTFSNSLLNEEHLTLHLQPPFIYLINTRIHSTNTCANTILGVRDTKVNKTEQSPCFKDLNSGDGRGR